MSESEFVEEKPERSSTSSGSGTSTPSAPMPNNGQHPDTIEVVGKQPGDKTVITEADCYEQLGFSYPTWKKWTILTVIFVVQVSMNFNASVYGNAVSGLQEQFSISAQAARVGQCVFLICYAIGCELWAPWSEEYGRWPIMQLSLLFVNIWQIPCALAQNFGTMVIGRVLGGFSSAGGSVTLGMVADMWEPENHHFGLAYIVFSSVGGSVVGPIVGAFVENSSLSWRWIFWLQLIFGGFTQILHFFLVPETRSSIMMDRIAKKRRKNGEDIWGPNEVKEKRITFRGVMQIWARPFIMFVREPIVLCLSLLSGFSDALIFTFIASYSLVYAQWNFSIIGIGLAFIPLLIGYVISYISFIPWLRRDMHRRQKYPDQIPPEARLFWLLFLVVLEPIGLFGFAWTSLGPPQVPWIAPMIFSALIAIANFAIYMATIDYMVEAYGEYSASATGGNGFARDFLAGIAAMYSIPMYSNIGPPHRHLEYASTILACLAVLVTIPVYVFYWYGPAIRRKSKFAQELASDRTVSRLARADKKELDTKRQTAHVESA